MSKNSFRTTEADSLNYPGTHVQLSTVFSAAAATAAEKFAAAHQILMVACPFGMGLHLELHLGIFGAPSERTEGKRSDRALGDLERVWPICLTPQPSLVALIHCPLSLSLSLHWVSNRGRATVQRNGCL